MFDIVHPISGQMRSGPSAKFMALSRRPYRHADHIVMLSLSKHLLVGREGYWRFFARRSE